jgi:hypothetical protein
MVLKSIKLTLLFLLFSLLGFSQVGHLKILLGENEENVTHYLDSLNALVSNPEYKIEKGVADDGDLTLTCNYSIYDEDKYSITMLMLVFQRTRGQEVCTNQRFMGDIKYAQTNLSFIKDNFSKVSDNKWTLPYEKNVKYNIVATFKKIESDFPVFVIDYFFDKTN